jgi:hypothetical protein
MERVTTESQLLSNAQRPAQQNSSSSNASTNDVDVQERPAGELQHEQELPHDALRPSIEIQGIYHLGPIGLSPLSISDMIF